MAFSSRKNVIAHVYTSQAASLSLLPQDSNDPEAQSTKAVKANFVTPQDPVIETANGGRANPCRSTRRGRLPLYGPPILLRNLQSRAFRVSSMFLSLAFLGTIFLGSLLISIPILLQHIYLRLTFWNLDQWRPFYEEEKRREQVRRDTAIAQTSAAAGHDKR
ncbi:MAG: hypothetical protein L6R38_005076 [Xanthoria sp. 2 TBL-2021]|nr:MAG: hypothetical protein L6R38_005076 [Xanthoria sp. 2 TBL-2021]